MGTEVVAFPKALFGLTEAMRANLPDSVTAFISDAVESRLPFSADQDIVLDNEAVV